MNINLIQPDELTPGLLQRWSEIVRENPYLHSPYFQPEFTQAVSRVREDVEIAVIHQDEQITGFFPFLRKRSSTGQPVGGRLSGFEGLITPQECKIDLKELLAASNLSCWQFDQLPESQSELNQFADKTFESHYIDLSNGFEHYIQQQKQGGSKRISKLGQLNRKLEREHGPLIFEFDVDQPELLDLLIKWKSEQFARTHYTDIFQFDWTSRLLKDLLKSNDAQLRGRLSVLWAQDRPVTLLYGLQSQQTFHGWFTVYDTEFSKYSPGSLSILRIAEAAATQGITRFDLGPGDQLFKQTLSSGSIKVHSGEVTFNQFRRLRHQTYRQAHDWLKHSRFRKTSDTIFNTLRPIKGWFDLK